MLIPLIGLTLGIVILARIILVYMGSSLVAETLASKLRGDKFFAIGGSLISLALMVGILGYLGYISATPLRLIRILLIVFGLILINSNGLKNILYSDAPILNQLYSLIVERVFILINLKIILTAGSIATLFSIFLISWFDATYSGDAWMYHIPFAGRIWGIITPEQYTFEYFTEHRFKGFALLAHFWQGFFWFIFQRPEATNLVCFFSLLILIFFLRNVLKIPFYLATISLLAIPMVHMHAARSYVDLPGNVAVSILILTVYLIYVKKKELNSKTLSVIVIAAAAAANTKHLLVPVVFFILLFILGRLLLQYWQSRKLEKSNLVKLSQLLIGSFLACLLIFATPIKNTLIYGNPFYPVQMEIAGTVLNHTEPWSNYTHENLLKFPPHIRWARSVLEINAFDARRPWKWTLAMDFISWNDERYGVGGFLGGYVIANLVLFIYLCWQNWCLESKVAAALMTIMTVFTPLLPQGYELRFYMYWMIVFVSLNAYLVCRLGENEKSNFWQKKIVNPTNFTLVALSFMLVFVDATDRFYTQPQFESFSEQLTKEYVIDPKIYSQINEGDRVCIVNKVPHTFLYNSYFHPPANYSVKAEFEVSDEFTQDKCGKREILE